MRESDRELVGIWGGGIDLFGAGRFAWKGALIELKLKLSDKKAIRD